MADTLLLNALTIAMMTADTVKYFLACMNIIPPKRGVIADGKTDTGNQPIAVPSRGEHGNLGFIPGKKLFLWQRNSGGVPQWFYI